MKCFCLPHWTWHRKFSTRQQPDRSKDFALFIVFSDLAPGSETFPRYVLYRFTEALVGVYYVMVLETMSCGQGHKPWWWSDGRVGLHSHGGASIGLAAVLMWNCPETCLLAGSCHESWHPLKIIVRPSCQWWERAAMRPAPARRTDHFNGLWWIRPSIHFKRTVSLWQLCSQTVETTHANESSIYLWLPVLYDGLAVA